MITVVNMIPQSLSGETNQDSEPNLAVNPANPQQIAGSAFTPDPMGGPNAPIYVSTNGGGTWSLNNIVASAGSIGTGDITQRFGGTSNRLYTGILDGASGNFEVHRSANFTSPTVETQLESRANEDQPYVQAATVMGGTGVGTDRVYIGVNDFNAGSQTATVEQTLDGGAAAPVFSSIRIEKRTTSGQDGAQIRPAIHGDGTVYAAFYRWITTTGSFPANTFVVTNADAIVVRDDNWGTGANPFTALTDASDGLSGRRVATALTFPFNRTGVNANGQERWGGDISIAVDPRSSKTVYLAFSTLVSGVYTLRLVRSLDRGVTWSQNPLLSLPNAKNPAVAINSLGKVGFVFQQLNGTGTTQRWDVHFRDSTNGTTWSDTILCSALAQAPTRTFSPYVGDYLHMMAVGKDFFGVFSANNTPDQANFPQGVTYQRNHDFVTKRLFALDGVTVVPPSIDPFFFKVTQIDGPAGSDYYVRDWTDSAASHDTGLEPSTNPVFYVASDVWNQRTNAAPTFVNDQPQNQDPQNDATNFAFCRVSRNTSGVAETVNVEFLVAELGTGSPYASVATTTVNFAAADTSKIASASWVLGPTSSTHLCLGVQVSTATDPFVAPGLNGMTPGWPTTDLVVINDNNKAQRNMSVHYGLSGFGSKHFGLIRNASKKPRDFVLRMLASGTAIEGFKAPRVQVQGGKAVSFKSGSTLTIAGMKPGERRWVSFDMAAFTAKVGTSLPVDFQEVVDDKVVNGFRINVTSAAPAQAWRELLLSTRAVFRRLEAAHKIAEAGGVAKDAATLSKRKGLTPAASTKFLVAHQDAIGASVKHFLALANADAGLDIGASLTAVLKALQAGKAEVIFGTTTTLLNKLDIAITLKRKK